MDGPSVFNAQSLIDKLAKLSYSKQKIEDLSRWCINHSNNAKQVVEIWDRQFYSSIKEQRVAFLYLANDIVQVSHRKGFEFGNEFLKVLPKALLDLAQDGDEYKIQVVRKLRNIWEERSVFGSPRHVSNARVLGKRNRDDKNKQIAGGIILEKLKSIYSRKYYNIPDKYNLLKECAMGTRFLMSLKMGRVDKTGKKAGHTDLIMQINKVNSDKKLIEDTVLCLTQAMKEKELEKEKMRNQLEVAKARMEQLIERVLLKEAPVVVPQPDLPIDMELSTTIRPEPTFPVHAYIHQNSPSYMPLPPPPPVRNSDESSRTLYPMMGMRPFLTPPPPPYRFREDVAGASRFSHMQNLPHGKNTGE